MNRFSNTLIIAVPTIAAMVGISAISYTAGQQSITPDPAPIVAGQHCWQEWNPTQDKSHEIICAVN